MSKYDSMTLEELKTVTRQIYGNVVNVDLLTREGLVRRLENWDWYVEKQRAMKGVTDELEKNANDKSSPDYKLDAKNISPSVAEWIKETLEPMEKIIQKNRQFMKKTQEEIDQICREFDQETEDRESKKKPYQLQETSVMVCKKKPVDRSRIKAFVCFLIGGILLVGVIWTVKNDFLLARFGKEGIATIVSYKPHHRFSRRLGRITRHVHEITYNSYRHHIYLKNREPLGTRLNVVYLTEDPSVVVVGRAEDSIITLIDRDIGLLPVACALALGISFAYSGFQWIKKDVPKKPDS